MCIRDRRIANSVPAKWLIKTPPAEYVEAIMAAIADVPKQKDKLLESIWNTMTKSPAFGKVFFYLTATDSDEVMSAGVDTGGIHTFNEDRTAINFTYEYKWIKEFGASSAYFWMKYSPQTDEGKTKYGSDGETIYLNTFQAWDLYSLVYDLSLIHILNFPKC